MGTEFDMVVGRRGQSYRDMRGGLIADAIWSTLQLPAAVFYQPDNVPAHHGAIRIGELDTVTIPDDEDGEITATGVLYDGRPGMERVQPWVTEAIALAAEGAIWPSVDPAVLEIQDTGDGDAAVLRADIPGVTLVSMPAFTGTSITLRPPVEDMDDDLDDVAMVAAVLGAGHDTMPVAPRDHAWDGTAAADRIATHCGVDTEGASGDAWTCYARGFLYRDDDAGPDTKGAYKLGFADIVDGDFTIIPAAVIAIAGVLQGARGGADIPEAQQERLRGTVAALYEHINTSQDTDLTPPWEETEAALIAATVATVREPAPADAFHEPDLDGYQPGYRIEGGRIFGHLTNRAACHRSWPASCVTPPESASNYAVANRYEIITTEGALEVGRVTTGLGTAGAGCTCHSIFNTDGSIGQDIDDHYCPGQRSAAAAIAHYDQLQTIADVMIGENEAGSVWVAGLLRPTLPDGAARVLQRRVWSGDWRPWGTGAELVDALALARSEPGFTHRTMHNTAAYTLIAASGPAPETVASQDDVVRALVREELAAAEHRKRLTAVAVRSNLAAITRN